MVDQPEPIVVREYRIREGCLPQGGCFRVLFDIVKKRSIRALEATLVVSGCAHPRRQA